MHQVGSTVLKYHQLCDDNLCQIQINLLGIACMWLYIFTTAFLPVMFQVFIHTMYTSLHC